MNPLTVLRSLIAAARIAAASSAEQSHGRSGPAHLQLGQRCWIRCQEQQGACAHSSPGGRV